MRAKWVAAIALLCVGVTIGGPVSSATEAPGVTPDLAEMWEEAGRWMGELEWKLSSNGMEGLSELKVVVWGLDSEFCRYVSLTESEITTQVELYLRLVPGLHVVGPDELGPSLHVNVNGMIITVGERETGFNAATLLELKQQAMLTRPPHGLIVWDAATWRTGGILGGPGGEDAGKRIQGMITKHLDEFQNEYLKANPDVKP